MNNKSVYKTAEILRCSLNNTQACILHNAGLSLLIVIHNLFTTRIFTKKEMLNELMVYQYVFACK